MNTLRWSRWGLLSICCSVSAWGQEPGNPSELFDKLDANKDGQVSVDEVPEEHRPHFERLLRRGNSDDNQTLSKDEWATAHQADPEPQPGAGAPGGFPGGREGRPNPGQMFERLDSNKDGKLQKSEIPEQAPERMREMLNRVFATADKDELTREELMQAMEEAMRGFGPREEGGPRPPGPDGDRRRPEGRPNEGDRRPPREGERGPEGRGRLRPDEPGLGGPSPDGPGPFGRPEMGGGPRGGLMGLLDENRDGRLSRDEFAKAATYFGDLDMNRDGSIDPSELMGGPMMMGGGERRGGRGSLGAPGEGPDDRFRQEFSGRRPDREEGLDGERMRDDRPPREEDGRGPGPDGRPGFRPSGAEGDRGGRPGFGGPGAGGGAGGGAGRFNPDEFWKQLDKDGDGGVSKEEAPERMKARFDEIDTNKDGKITQDEARASMERRFGGRGAGGRGGRPGGAEGEGGPRPPRPEAEPSLPEGDKPAEEKPAE